MNVLPPPEAPIAIEVRQDHGLWRFRSADGLLSGAFRDRRDALRAAVDEAEGHPGYVVVSPLP